MTPAQLRTQLERQGLNQTEAAKLLGVTDRTVRFWLAGTYPIPLWVDRLFWLIKFGGLSARQLLARIG
jgi:hypothetical protein